MITGTMEFTQTIFSEFFLEGEKENQIILILPNLVNEDGAQMTHSLQYYLIK